MNREEALQEADTLPQELADLAYGMAVRLHSEVGQTYDGLPYAETHCVAVRAVLAEFGFTTPFWRAVAMLHDVLEDTMRDREPMARFSYLREHFGDLVAHVVWCVSGFGDTRKLRNADIKAKIALDVTELSPVLKLADRIANVRRSHGGYLNMYRKELPEFEALIRPKVPEAMWQELLNTFARAENI